MKNGRNRAGGILMGVGTALLLTAAALSLANGQQEQKARMQVQKAMEKVTVEIAAKQKIDVAAAAEAGTSVMPDPEDPLVLWREAGLTDEPETLEVDGACYLGYLTIPTLGVELPIQDTLTEEHLLHSPCRQFGTVQARNLVIGGHNYRTQFGNLSSLQPGDSVLLTQADGEQIAYEVQQLYQVEPWEVEAVKDSPWDLVLYTCTYDRAHRTAVGCSAAGDAPCPMAASTGAW